MTATPNLRANPALWSAGAVLLLALVAQSRGGDAVPAASSAVPASHGGHDGHEEEGCMRCHEEMRPVLDAAVPHLPAQEEECTLCHDPHAARYDHLLAKRERALCFGCHKDERIAFVQGQVHTPVQRGECTGCHEVHGSANAGLVKVEGNELCLGCHDEMQAQAALPTVHEPFVEGECMDCHDPHASPNASQLVAPAAGLCRVCHSVQDEDLIEAHSGIPIAGTRCTSCHEVHASTHAGLLLENAHPPFAQGDCDLCHMLDSDTPQLVGVTGGRLCAPCHKGYQDSKKKVVHKPVAEGTCNACHATHASRFDGMLLGSTRETCLRCHTEIAEKAAAARTVHTWDEEIGACAGCHQPHSSDDAKLLTAGEIRGCMQCHADQKHGHPLGEDRVDPRTGGGITCVTCHDPHGTDFPYQLRGDQTRGLCLECHTGGDDGGDH